MNDSRRVRTRRGAAAARCLSLLLVAGDAACNGPFDAPNQNYGTLQDLKGRVVNCFMKCEADRRGTLRGRRQIMLDDSDVHHHRHSKAAVGGVAALAIGDPAVFVSVDAMHQGPHGGGPVIAIVEMDE